jgi:hypothetical protein
MNAMTWWDHKTESIWSQPLGQALEGPLRGAKLELLPSQLMPWKTWRAEYPDTLALNTEVLGVFGSGYGREYRQIPYVIGVTLGDAATAFPYDLAAQAGLVNEWVGPYPVVVHVDAERRSVHVYLRQVDGRDLTFDQRGAIVRDRETGSTWQMDTGLAVDGLLAGRALRTVPYIPAFHGAWRDFYPHSRWYDGR